MLSSLKALPELHAESSEMSLCASAPIQQMENLDSQLVQKRLQAEPLCAWCSVILRGRWLYTENA